LGDQIKIYVYDPESTCSFSRPGRMDKRRRRYSKKSKKNLRKFTDVTDVEEFLEEKRREERTG